MYNNCFSTFKVANKLYRLVLISKEESTSFFKENAELYEIDPKSNFSNIGRIWKIIDSAKKEALIIQFYGEHAGQSSRKSSVFISSQNYFGITEAAVKYAIKHILEVLY